MDNNYNMPNHFKLRNEFTVETKLSIKEFISSTNVIFNRKYVLWLEAQLVEPYNKRIFIHETAKLNKLRAKFYNDIKDSEIVAIIHYFNPYDMSQEMIIECFTKKYVLWLENYIITKRLIKSIFLDDESKKIKGKIL